MKKIKIAILASPHFSIPPEKYGGAEIQTHYLTEGLIEKGFEVDLYASGDSKTKANLVPITKVSLSEVDMEKNPKVKLARAITLIGLSKLIEKSADYDLVQINISSGSIFNIAPFVKLFKCPVIFRLNYPLNEPGNIEILEEFPEYKNLNFVAPSEAYKKDLSSLNYIGTAYNGIDINRYELSQNVNDNLLFIGRISPDKGPIEAIEVAKRSNKKLIMAARLTRPSYYEEEIKPLIDGEQIKFLGEVPREKVAELMSTSAALIFPIKWNEPFANVPLEAMASGCPVISLDNGSIGEQVVDGKTGFICKDVNEMTEKVKLIDTISRQDCREHIAQNFSPERMVETYIDIYKQFVK